VLKFIGKHIERLKSRYDLMERKNQLGETFDQSLDIDLIQFEKNASQILQNRELNPKNILLAIYASYAICLGQDIREKRLFFHHAHHFDALDPFLKDFPNSKVIFIHYSGIIIYSPRTVIDMSFIVVRRKGSPFFYE
jgi:hypothetical protein